MPHGLSVEASINSIMPSNMFFTLEFLATIIPPSHYLLSYQFFGLVGRCVEEKTTIRQNSVRGSLKIAELGNKLNS